MPEISIKEEMPLSLAEVKDFLDSKKKDKKELNFRENKSLEYINSFSVLKKDKAESLKKELNELEMARLKEKQIVKIVDLLPKNVDDLKIILSGEDITLKAEDLNKIVETVKKYV